MFLGVDGGGTKTAYALIDVDGDILASHLSGSVSYLSEGIARATAVLIEGIGTTLAKAALRPADLNFTFVGLPAYGEDSSSIAQLDAMPAELLASTRYRCGNDMVCSWAGSLACADGISVIAGTGSMAYGEYAGRNARAGGWGELIGDEGSAYWIAREGMNLFSRMSDGRAERGPLYGLVRKRLGIEIDLDFCAQVYGEGAKRGVFAQFAPVVDEAAQAGDTQAEAIFLRAADELLQCVCATRRSLAVPDTIALPVSNSGGVFSGSQLLTNAFRSALSAAHLPFEYRAPRYPPVIGAALYAARLSGAPLTGTALESLGRQSKVEVVPQ
jgi:N-acetylglucosamine kinase-like BadF-type ATPase